MLWRALVSLHESPRRGDRPGGRWKVHGWNPPQAVGHRSVPAVPIPIAIPACLPGGRFRPRVGAVTIADRTVCGHRGNHHME